MLLTKANRELSVVDRGKCGVVDEGKHGYIMDED